MTRIFLSTELLRLYNLGYLDDILQKYNLNENTFIGAGGDASAFFYNNDEVIKLCSKKIPFFDNNNRSAHDLLNLSRKYSRILLQINLLLYEDDYIFIYTQNKCNKFKNKMINNRLNELLFISKIIIESNFYTSISFHNLGIHNDTLLIFDFHGLKFIEWNDCNVGEQHWFRKLFKCLFTGIAIKYKFRLIKKLTYSILLNLNYNTFIIFNKCNADTKYKKLLHYISTNDKLYKTVIIELLELCIDKYE